MTVMQAMSAKWPAMATTTAAPSSGSVAELSSSSSTSACAVRGHWQARLRHQRKQAYGFDRDGFAAGIWAGDDELTAFAFQFDGYWNDGHTLEFEVSLQQRM